MVLVALVHIAHTCHKGGRVVEVGGYAFGQRGERLQVGLIYDIDAIFISKFVEINGLWGVVGGQYSVDVVGTHHPESVLPLFVRLAVVGPHHAAQLNGVAVELQLAVFHLQMAETEACARGLYDLQFFVAHMEYKGV